MKAALITLFTLFALGSAYAEEASPCAARAAEKKLAGAALKSFALKSFMTKCERDANSTCDASATEKKLHGAARTSFTNKCVKDAVGK